LGSEIALFSLFSLSLLSLVVMTTKTKREEEKEKEEEEEEETTRRSSSGSSSGSSSSEKEVRDFIIFCLSFCCGVTFFFQKRFEISFFLFRAKNDALLSLFRFFLSLKRALTPSLFLSLCVYFFVAGSTAGSVERQRERFGRGRR
jgi:uncharacterized membrane protein YesL